MSAERLSFTSNAQSLAPLVEKTDLLVMRSGSVVCPEKIEVPLDEHGIPRRVTLMRQVLDTLNTQHIWTGEYDLHHVAWPGAEYRELVDSDGTMVGSRYRGAGSLKVRMPRQLHNYVHATTNPPKMPDIDVIRQYGIEHYDADRLYNTIKLTNYDDKEELACLDFEVQERLRADAYQRKLDAIKPGQLGVLPDLGYLAGLSIQEARPVLRGIVRVQSLSKRQISQRQLSNR